MTIRSSEILSPNLTHALLRWINRGLEALWLLLVVLVPLAFIDRDYAVSEAVIAYVEVPKIALLRTIAGLMAILCLVQWAVHGTFSQESTLQSIRSKLRPYLWLAITAGSGAGDQNIATAVDDRQFVGGEMDAHAILGASRFGRLQAKPTGIRVFGILVGDPARGRVGYRRQPAQVVRPRGLDPAGVQFVAQHGA
mgnify:CR=1 FL=1